MAKKDEVRSDSGDEIVLLSGAKEAGWFNQFNKLEIVPFQECFWDNKFKLDGDVNAFVNDPNKLDMAIEFIWDSILAGVESMIECINANLAFFKRDSANEISKNQLEANIFVGYLDSIFKFLSSYNYGYSSKQLKEDVKLRINGGIRTSLLFSRLHVSYTRLSDGKLVDDYYPIIIAVPPGMPYDLTRQGLKSYTDGDLGGFFDPGNRSIVSLATSLVDFKKSTKHEITHAVINSINDYLQNDMYGREYGSQKEEMWVHYVTDRLATFVALDDELSKLQVQANLSTGILPYAITGVARSYNPPTRIVDLTAAFGDGKSCKRGQLRSLLQSHFGSNAAVTGHEDLPAKLLVESIASSKHDKTLGRVLTQALQTKTYKEINKKWEKIFLNLKSQKV